MLISEDIRTVKQLLKFLERTTNGPTELYISNIRSNLDHWFDLG